MPDEKSGEKKTTDRSAKPSRAGRFALGLLLFVLGAAACPWLRLAHDAVQATRVDRILHGEESMKQMAASLEGVSMTWVADEELVRLTEDSIFLLRSRVKAGIDRGDGKAEEILKHLGRVVKEKVTGTGDPGADSRLGRLTAALSAGIMDQRYNRVMARYHPGWEEMPYPPGTW